MPTICFADDFDVDEKRILSKTFKSNCNDLKIAHRDFSVYVRREVIGGPNKFGFLVRECDDKFIIMLNSLNDLLVLIFALGHEMVHGEQYLRGALKDADGGTYWGDQFVPNKICSSKIFYSALPWEVEAHNLQRPLYDNALDKLNKYDIELLWNMMHPTAADTEAKIVTILA